MSKQRRYIESITQQMINYAQLNFDKRLDIYSDPEIDEVIPGLAVGVNILGEELQQKVQELNNLNAEIRAKNNLLNSITVAVPEVIVVYNEVLNKITFLNKCMNVRSEFLCPAKVLEIPEPCSHCTVKDLVLLSRSTRVPVAEDQCEIQFQVGSQKERWYKSTRSTFESDEFGKRVSSLVTLTDITVLKTKEMELIHNERVISEALNEKALLLQEVHHRVKNNLQIIYGLLSMQANRAESEEVKDQLVEIKNRIFSISLIHEELYQSDNFAMIDVDRYCRKLCESLSSVYRTDHQVELILEVESGIKVGIDHATPLGLLINEVLCNSYKHAFKGSADGKIWLKGHATESHYVLEIRDNGKGACPESIKAKAGNSLGNKLITGLAQQLRAKLDVNYENGYAVTFTIPRTSI